MAASLVLAFWLAWWSNDDARHIQNETVPVDSGLLPVVIEEPSR